MCTKGGPKGDIIPATIGHVYAGPTIKPQPQPQSKLAIFFPLKPSLSVDEFCFHTLISSYSCMCFDANHFPYCFSLALPQLSDTKSTDLKKTPQLASVRCTADHVPRKSCRISKNGSDLPVRSANKNVSESGRVRGFALHLFSFLVFFL